MRLAFQHFGGDAWVAGNVFIENMFLALRTLGSDRPALTLVVDPYAREQDLGALAASADQVLPGPAQPLEQALRIQQSLRYHVAWRLRTGLLHTPMPAAPHPLVKFLRDHQVDAFFTLAQAESPVASLPSVVWLPDFQHRRLPDNFAPEERASRDHVYSVLAHGATRLLLTSAEVCHDLEAFAPDCAHKARQIAYVAMVPAEVYSQDPRNGLAAYHLPDKFIYLPNQFWKHKNHQLVFEALSQLNTRGIRPRIVSTGNPIDYRQPSLFAELLQMLSRLNIRDQFIFLGQVSRLDMFRLIRQSLCVLNPSQFEGLGLSVAESKSLGKRVLVSNLAPLREQEAPGAIYFNPDDPADLANKLEMIWTTAAAGPDAQLELAAAAALPQRQAAFGRELLQVFSEAQAEFQSRGAH